MDDCTASASDSASSAAAPDPDAFERLTIPLLTDVTRFARSLTRDEGRADDLVQETYLQALRGWHTFRPGADPKRWLLTVCHNAFARALRREARYVEAPDDDPALQSVATARAHWHAQETGLLRLVEHMDLGPAIERAMTRLPAVFRPAIVLVDVEGYSYEEAASILNVAVGTVRSRLFRGRRLLQESLFEFARDAGFEVLRGSGAPSSSAPVSRSNGPPNSRKGAP